MRNVLIVIPLRTTISQYGFQKPQIKSRKNEIIFISFPPFPFYSLNPTTNFLTATTLILPIGAGITAAAGTRLALQLILDKGFK